ncbi:MAG: hypothetical protein LC802_14060 [Acidobacteria bacterium]|nr:hypothetical protein [Acidobacteriota bacterium]
MMQDYSNPGQPPGTFGRPPTPAKKGLSKGCLIGIIVAVVAAVGLAVLLTLGVGGAFWLSRRTQEAARDAGAVTPGTSTASRSSSSSDADDVEGPAPTAEQSAAISGGQEAAWAQQEISWTVPVKWKEHSADSRSLLWRSPGSWDAASLIGSISPMAADFPMDISLNAFYQQAQTRKQNGEVDEVRWLKLDGVKGVMFRESSPEDADNPQRLQWMAYRTYKGQQQLVNIMLATRGKDFARHEDALYGVLYSMKMAK